MTAPTSDCGRYLGFLSERPKEMEIPEDCVTCSQLLRCMLHKLETSSGAIAEESRALRSQRAYINSDGTLGRTRTLGQRQPLPPLESLLERMQR